MTLDLNKQPARGAVNGNNNIVPAGFFRHLGRLFDIEVNEPGSLPFFKAL